MERAQGRRVARRGVASAALTLTLAGSACHPVYRAQCIVPAVAPGAPGDRDVQVTFLAAGGVLIRAGGAAVMTPPLYTNPTVGELATGEINPDTELIDALLPPVADVRAILVGHSHYDHALDLPYIALHKAVRADIYGSQNLARLLKPIAAPLAAKDPPTAVRVVESAARTPCGPGLPVAGTRFRIQPIVSEHSAQLVPSPIARTLIPDIAHPVRLWRGDTLLEPGELPRTASGWTAGRTFAYLIDVLAAEGSSEVVFRIYYQDSPTRTPVGHPPACGPAVDLAILCVGGAEGIPRFPADLLGQMRPRFVLGTHWEDFFSPLVPPVSGRETRTVFAIPSSHTKRIVGRARRSLPPGSEISVPCPGSSTVFTRSPGGAWSRQDGSTMGWSSGTARSVPR